MYMILGIVMLLRGFSDAIMMRAQQAMAFNGSEGYLTAHHYDQVFTAHGVIMIFFVAMPIVTGLMNYVVPLQIGARDVSFPFLNNFSFWMTAAGAVIVMMILFVGEFARTGWLAMPPLSGIGVSARRRCRLLYLGVADRGRRDVAVGRQPDRDDRQDARARHDHDEDADLLLDRAVHQHPDRRRLPGADRGARAAQSSTATSAPRSSRTTLGGNPMMYVNLIWIWGHPEVYILILPAFGVFSRSHLDLLGQAPLRLHARWSMRRSSSRSSPISSGCTTSSRWGRARASTRSSASPR